MTHELQQQLQQLFSNAVCPKILDARSSDEFKRCRLKNSVNIDLPNLTSSCFLLPDKHTPFAVVVPSHSTYSVTEDPSLHKQCLSDKSVAVYLKGAASLQDFLTSRGWTVTHFLKDCPLLWSAAKELLIIEQQPADCVDLATRCLFAPSGLLSGSIDDIEDGLTEHQLCQLQQQQQLQVIQQQGSAYVPSFVFRCLDVGCGSGRDMAWLASRQQIKEVRSHQAHTEQQEQHVQQQRKLSSFDSVHRVLVSWHVTGVDEWLGALERAHDLAAAMQLTPQQVQLVYGGVNKDTGDVNLLRLPDKSRLRAATHASVVHADATQHSEAGLQGCLKEFDVVQQRRCDASLAITEATATVDSTTWSGMFDVVLCVRFLERSLLPRLRDMLSPGGYILYSTFVDGPGLKAFGRPSGPDHVLQPGELARDYFGPDQGFSVLQDKVELTADGREVCYFIARFQA